MRTIKQICSDLALVQVAIRETSPASARIVDSVIAELREGFPVSKDRDRRHHEKCRARQAEGKCYSCGAVREDGNDGMLCANCKQRNRKTQKRSYERKRELVEAK